MVYLTDVVEEAERRVREIIQEKNPDLDPKLRGTVARQIGLGALAYSMLSVDNNKDIVFHWEEALNFEGESAPYIQNAHVRANSILRKAEKFPTEANYDYDLDPMEIELIEALSKFPTVAEKAAMEYKPLHLSNYVYQLAQTFHSFYQRVPVLKSETAAMRNARLRIVAAVKWVLAKGLWLLDIEAPEVM